MQVKNIGKMHAVRKKKIKLNSSKNISKKLKEIHSSTSAFNNKRHNRILEALDDCSSMAKEEFKSYTESLSCTNACAWYRKCLKITISERSHYVIDHET